MRRRSCPQLTESQLPSQAPRHRSAVAPSRPPEKAQRASVPTMPCPSEAKEPEQTPEKPAHALNRSPIHALNRSPIFQPELSGSPALSLGLQRKQEDATPVSPALLRNDHEAKVAHTVADRLCGSLDAPWPLSPPDSVAEESSKTPSAPEESNEKPEGPKSFSAPRRHSGLHESLAAWRSKQQLPGQEAFPTASELALTGSLAVERNVRSLPARFTPVDLGPPRFRSSNAHTFHSSAPIVTAISSAPIVTAISSPWVQCRNVNEIQRNWNSPLRCSSKLS